MSWLLHIYDAEDWRIRQTAGARDEGQELPIRNSDPMTALDALVRANGRFNRILFETHGSPGRIVFGNYGFGANWLRSVRGRGYSTLTTKNARIYFNGCNVAAGAAGWDFLQAAAEVFLTPGGGEVFGHTSVGFGNPLSGHVVHLWGDTRRLYVDSKGKVIERTEQ